VQITTSNISASSVIFKKLPKENDHPLGEFWPIWDHMWTSETFSWRIAKIDSGKLKGNSRKPSWSPTNWWNSVLDVR
jgi:hypothetical protein